MRKQSYNNSPGMTTVIYSSGVNPRGAKADLLLTKETSEGLGKTCFNLVILDGLHRDAVDDILLKAGKHLWTAGPLPIHLIIHRDGANIKQA